MVAVAQEHFLGWAQVPISGPGCSQAGAATGAQLRRPAVPGSAAGRRLCQRRDAAASTPAASGSAAGSPGAAAALHGRLGGELDPYALFNCLNGSRCKLHLGLLSSPWAVALHALLAGHRLPRIVPTAL